MQNLFINIKNEKTYDIVGFARRKAPGGDWVTEIAYSPDGSPQIYIRTVEDFFTHFIPYNCWHTATDEQKAKMKEVAKKKPLDHHKMGAKLTGTKETNRMVGAMEAMGVPYRPIPRKEPNEISNTPIPREPSI